MKIVVGHKVLNLEELTNVACFDGGMSEVIVDSQLYADLSTAPPQQAEKPSLKPLQDLEGKTIELTKE